MNRIGMVQQYLLNEKKCPELVVNRLLDKIIKYDDILNDFCHWLETRDYYNEDAVVVEGYSAQAIVDAMPMLDGIGAYDMLVDLRERPKEALKALNEEIFG